MQVAGDNLAPVLHNLRHGKGLSAGCSANVKHPVAGLCAECGGAELAGNILNMEKSVHVSLCILQSRGFDYNGVLENFRGLCRSTLRAQSLANRMSISLYGVHSGINGRCAKAGSQRPLRSLRPELKAPLFAEPKGCGILRRKALYSRQTAEIRILAVSHKGAQNSVHKTGCLRAAQLLYKLHGLVHRRIVRHGIHIEKLIKSHAEHLRRLRVELFRRYGGITPY